MNPIVKAIGLPVVQLLQQFKVTPLTNAPGNEMIRFGVGRNGYRAFARVDVWNKGFRVTKR
jgi:hypothetical protein